MQLSPCLLHSVWAGLFIQNKYNFQKQGYDNHFFFFNLQKVSFWCEKMGGKMNSFSQTCLACSKQHSTVWLRDGCERKGAHRWQQEQQNRGHFHLQGTLSSCSSLCSQPKNFDHFQSNLQCWKSCLQLGVQLVQPKCSTQSFFAKGYRRRKIPFLVPGPDLLSLLCKTTLFFFCHKLISWSADSQGHFNFTSEICLEGAKLFYSLENIKWPRLPQATK